MRALGFSQLGLEGAKKLPPRKTIETLDFTDKENKDVENIAKDRKLWADKVTKGRGGTIRVMMMMSLTLRRVRILRRMTIANVRKEGRLGNQINSHVIAPFT